jgi:DNA-binding NtrC family response regulator
MAKRILSVSYDEALLTTRHHILEKAGFEVVSALGYIKAMEEYKKQKFDLVLLGHTLPANDKTALIARARDLPGCPVLTIRRHGDPPHPDADYSVDASDGPQKLLDVIQAALGRSDPE